MDQAAWTRIEAEARTAAPFPLRAYSELMPPPFVGVKPYAPRRAHGACTASASHDGALDITEYEQAQELRAGLERIGGHVGDELKKLIGGAPHALSRTLLDGNPAWPAELAAAAAAQRLADDPVVLLLSIALSRTQDDFGNVRWTLFGASHEGAATPFWRSVDRVDRLTAWLTWAGVDPRAAILADPDDPDDAIPAPLHGRRLDPDAPALSGIRTIVTFRPFATLPPAVRAAYLARTLTLVPCPASLVFFHHPRYRALAGALPHATQIPLLHLFPRIEQSCTIRIPQSGWLDEHDPAQAQAGGPGHGHKVVAHVRRTHRWQRVARDQRDADTPVGDGAFTDKVTTALFSTDAEELGLYGKPMAKNAQIWSEDYQLLLDGPKADRAAIARAAAVVDAGGHFGYRFLFPPMRAGRRDLYWHLPVVARPGAVLGLEDGAPRGYVTAERSDDAGAAPLMMTPHLLARPLHATAAALPAEPGRGRFTASHNARKLLDLRALLDAPLAPSFARAALRVGSATTLDAWLDHHDDHDLAAGLRACVATGAGADDPGPALTFDRTANRAFEEEVWRSIASLSEGEWRQKENADGIAAALQHGKRGGPAAKAAGLHVAERRDLERLGDHLHERHRALIAAHGMTGRAQVVDHVFAWETDFDYPWMLGWAKNQRAPSERNVVCMIPGKNRGEAVIMGDHYDTAYMEDVYDADRGGDGLRAPAAGADDNCSATTALLRAADVLLAMSARGQLERDVWLVHLTGEEFPADSLGARAIVQGLVERNLAFTDETGARVDVSGVTVVGAYVLDMIGHNNEKHRDVFQISPGEGAASARLALRAHRATERWNRAVPGWNQAAGRRGRATRMPDGAAPPPPFAHLALAGEVRVEWEPRSSLFNTDGQCFSDCGVPVVLFMENYDIDRHGYHDTLDTMANLDLDYCAALTAIAIEAVADAACAT